MYNQFKYMYNEGLFEEKVDNTSRTDFMFNFHINYLKNQNINKYMVLLRLFIQFLMN